MTSHNLIVISQAFVHGPRNRPDPPQRDMPDDHRPDPDNTADFELSDQQTLIDAFTAGLCIESARQANMTRTFAAFQLCLPPCQIRVSVMNMSRLKMKLYTYATKYK
jgi:hypothetical protein